MKHFLKLLHNIYFITSLGLLVMCLAVCECSFGGITVYSVFDQSYHMQEGFILTYGHIICSVCGCI